MKFNIFFILVSLGIGSASLQAENLNAAQECPDTTRKCCHKFFQNHIFSNKEGKYVGCSYINSSCFNTFETFGEQVSLPPCPALPPLNR